MDVISFVGLLAGLTIWRVRVARGAVAFVGFIAGLSI